MVGCRIAGKPRRKEIFSKGISRHGCMMERELYGLISGHQPFPIRSLQRAQPAGCTVRSLSRRSKLSKRPMAGTINGAYRPLKNIGMHLYMLKQREDAFRIIDESESRTLV